MNDFKYEAYKFEKIEVYSDYIEKYKDDLTEDLAADILHNLDIDFYEVESAILNFKKDNPNPHMLIEYTVKIANTK